ncbi:Transcriptional regulator [Seminavis robusta]|uniref:Transcriptional regulator n=1 Tax=Seminavis robusta TaxID=568900 RepID=A0A9N8HS32_9STRA|nr:Transcriptional regulator [Seminavis robusta]|eukprot:Sro1339_g264300.1 Transcriptional regulator (1305) ;mRNA; f:16448-20427
MRRRSEDAITNGAGGSSPFPLSTLSEGGSASAPLVAPPGNRQESLRRSSLQDEFLDFVQTTKASTALHQRLSDNENVKQFTMNKLRFDRLEESVIPVGRDGEYEVLRERLQEVWDQKVQRELVLLSGYSGSGKTTLAASIQPLVERKSNKGGLFVLSKFDYLDLSGGGCSSSVSSGEGSAGGDKNNADPFAAVSNAFGRICRDIQRRKNNTATNTAIQELTSESDTQEEIDHPMASLCKELSQVLTSTDITFLEDIMPEIELLVSPQSSNNHHESRASIFHESRASIFHESIATISHVSDDSMSHGGEASNQTSKSRRSTNGGDTRAILYLAVRKFLRVVTKHLMLCIVWDDLQWADTVSLELLQSILSDSKIENLVIIALFRSNEVKEHHPWAKTMEICRQHAKRGNDIGGLHITDMPIGNLNAASVNSIVMVLLNVDDVATTMDLAETCHARTQGNVYFLLTFLEMLHDEGLLMFHLGTFQWTWDSREILEKTVATANTVSLLMDKITKSSGGNEMTRMLPIAALLGSCFEARMLRLVWEELRPRGKKTMSSSSQQQTEAADNSENNASSDDSFVGLLEMTVEEKFLERVDTSTPTMGSLRFCHDEIQKASLNLVSGAKLEKLKVCVGAVLLHKLRRQELEESIFVVTNLLNSKFAKGVMDRLDKKLPSRRRSELTERSYHTTSSVGHYSVGNTALFLQRLVKEGPMMDMGNSDQDHTEDQEDDEELGDIFRVRLAQLNLQAAERARKMSAFHSAARYAAKGIAWLDEKHKWSGTTFDLTLNLYNLAAEANSNVGKMEVAEEYCHYVLDCEMCSIPDKMHAYRIVTNYKAMIGNNKEALAICLDVLQQLGVKFPTILPLKAAAALRAILRVKKMKPLSLQQLEGLPRMKDKRLLAVMNLLDIATILSYAARDEPLSMLLLERMRKLTLQHGLCKESVQGILFPGFVNCFLFEDWKNGVAHADASLIALECLGDDGLAVYAKATWQVEGMCHSWVQPLAGMSSRFELGFIRGLQTGDIDSAAMCAWKGLITDFLSGRTTLDRLIESCQNYIPQVASLQRMVYLVQFQIFLQHVTNLSDEKATNTTSLTGGVMDEQETRDSVSNVEVGKMLLLVLDVHKQIACTFFGDHEAGAELAMTRGDSIIHRLPGYSLGAVCPVMRAVSLYAMVRRASGLRKIRYKREAVRLRKMVRRWAEKGFVNVAHFSKLLDAEHFALTKRTAETDTLFQKARALAARSGFRQDAALICERHAEFLLHVSGKRPQKAAVETSEASRQIEEAIRYYTEWGAMNKVKLLRSKYAFLLSG